MFEINTIASVSVIMLQAAITTTESKFYCKAKETVSPKQYFCTSHLGVPHFNTEVFV